jgi:hypothetical protein
MAISHLLLYTMQWQKSCKLQIPGIQRASIQSSRYHLRATCQKSVPRYQYGEKRTILI